MNVISEFKYVPGALFMMVGLLPRTQSNILGSGPSPVAVSGVLTVAAKGGLTAVKPAVFALSGAPLPSRHVKISIYIRYVYV